jgi:hypothetical protein
MSGAGARPEFSGAGIAPWDSMMVDFGWKEVIRMRRFILYGLMVGLGTLVARSLPDIRRYIRISRM